MLARLLGARQSCVFICDALAREESIDVFMKFAIVAAGAAEFLQGFNSQTEADPGVRRCCQERYDELRNAYLKFCSWLQAEAKKDLGPAMPRALSTSATCYQSASAFPCA